ncbi:MAG: alpha/beta fold hydrolase [Bacteroidales bacterium]|nr:alpha/beta fold hydrolase [Bacteroidales bacterium]
MNKDFNFIVEGSGKPIVFVHGFAETKHTWTFLINELKNYCCCYAIDLPGHGDAPFLNPLTIQTMANHVAKFVESYIQQKVFIAGHSMGGYVALEMAHSFPELVNGIGLINSHAARDTEETISARKRTIEIIKHDRFSFLGSFIENLFYEPLKDKLQPTIQQLIEISSNISKETLIATQEAMMNRQDHLELLLNAPFPFVFVLGKQDSRIDFSRVLGQTILPKVAYCLFLENSAHMSHIEYPREVSSIIRSILEFLKNDNP